ncbi:hypothetical protein AGMMS49992_05070 [Clostridia bacterium]|nr:hypothetical protein AGMMS49992_05070 [Clostridia bacterium]
MNREPTRGSVRRNTSGRRPLPRGMVASRRKRAKPKPRLGGVALLLVFALAGVLVWQLNATVFKRTAIVTAGETGHTYPVDTIVIRNEQLYDTDNTAGLKYIADDGALVARGTQIAQVYSSGYNQTDISNINKLMDTVKTYYQKLLSESSYPDTRLAALDGAVETLVAQMRRTTQASGSASLLSLKRQLERAMTERQNYLKQKFPNDTTLNRYAEDEKPLRKRVESWTMTYIADRQAIVSFYPDGYERMLSGGTVEELSPAAARGVLNGAPPEQTAAERARTNVYKLVEPRGFYVAALTTDKNWKPQPDEAFKLVLEGLDDTVYDARVTTTTRTGGELLVRFYVDADVTPVLDYRRAKATVGELAVRGLLVPADALHTQDGQIGVVLDTNPGVFIPVNVLTNDAKEAIVRPVESGALAEGYRIRRF